MGIKDKVLDILFDGDEEEGQKRPVTHSTQEKRKYSTNSLLDTGSIFIDATSPLPKEKKRFEPEIQKDNYYEVEQEEAINGNDDYRLSENISPIFGPLDNKGKVKNKAIAKAKKFNDTTIKNFDNLNKNSGTSYTNIVISPFFGPMPLKPVKKNVKPRKKQNDEFDRDIDDTGSFDAVLSKEEEQVAPRFEDVDEEVQAPVIESNDSLMDTDKLARISDRINQIKNQAANIYDDSLEVEEEVEDVITDEAPAEQQEYEVETEVHSNISDVIHSLKDHDGFLNHNDSSYQGILPRQEIATEAVKPSNDDEEPTYSEPIETQNIESISTNQNNINIDIPNEETSIDDIFDDEDEIEENKDLFSVLFGDD